MNMRKHKDPDKDVGGQKVQHRLATEGTQTNQNGRRGDEEDGPKHMDESFGDLRHAAGVGVAKAPDRSPGKYGEINEKNKQSKGQWTTATSRPTARQARQLRPMDDSEEDGNSEDDSTTNSDIPGAFKVEGWNNTSPDDGTVQYCMGLSNENDEETNLEEESVPRGDEKLVVAELAPTTVEGTAVLLQQDQQQQQEQEQHPTAESNIKSTLLLLSGAFIGIVVTGIIIIIVIFVPQNKETTAAPAILTTQSPTTTTTTTTTEQTPTPTTKASTIAPSSPPTTTRLPTQMPTPTIREIVIGMLSPFIPDVPSTTIQQQALDWIVENDFGHVERQQPNLLLERFVLAIIFLSMNGDYWDDGHSQSWLSPFRSVCGWHDIRCDSENKVINVDLVSDNLSGSIPSEVGTLTALSLLSLGTNNLSGAIPSEIGRLTALTYLGVYENNMFGTIPSEIGRLTALTFLGLWLNKFSGTIPSEVGELTSLTYLGLSTNNLTGVIPSDLGRLSALTGLHLFNNNLSGSFPSELIQISESLVHCGLANNPILIGIPSNCDGCLSSDPPNCCAC